MAIEPFFGFSKVGYLQMMCNRFGDFKVAKGWRTPDGDIRWTKHRSVLECWQSDEGLRFLEEVNNRGGLSNELRIDIDAGDRIPEQVRKHFEDACDFLDKKGIHYLGFSSGSKGYHIHIVVENVISRQLFSIMKQAIISKVGGELLKINSGSMLTLEWAPNNKTGRIKTPIRGDLIWLEDK